jgi:hypothetical protein
VAALLSPVLWRINQPDRFDMYSAGIVLMQLAFANLRNDSNLIAFRNKLEDCDHDITKWRASVERKGGAYADGFALLDAQGGWDLLCKVRTLLHRFSMHMCCFCIRFCLKCVMM